MRKIRFRGMNGVNLIFGDLHHFEDEGVIYTIITADNGKEFPVQQNTVGEFTGLLDKNGKVIYEGDVVRSVKGDLWVIGFERGSFGATLLQENGVWRSCSTRLFEEEDFEVVGNIHKNPELLES